MTLSSLCRRTPHAFAVATLVLLLTACSGGGGESTSAITSSTDSYTVSASAGTGGVVTPTSVTVNRGATTTMTVTPDTGYDIDAVTGCGGTLSGTTYTTGAITAACAVSATFAALPSVTISNASVVEGSSGTSNLTFTVSLSALANGNVNVDYATYDGSATTASGDYTTANGTLTISGGATSGTVTVTVNGDTIPEADELLTLTLSNVSANATLGTASATGTIVSDDPFGVLNDTGITLCGDYAYDGGSGTHNNSVDCAVAGATQTVDGTETANGLDPVPAGQDAHFGRDVTANDDSDGHAGFAFTKIDASGNPLAADATSWGCVLDTVTGLMWEVKTTDSGLRDKAWTYTWYNSDSATNGGSVGTANGGICFDTNNCDTEKFVAAVNAAGLCGVSDWRLPNKEELSSLVDSSVASPGPTIDTGWFPNTGASYYWSASPFAGDSGGAWSVNFNYGYVGSNGRDYAFYVRLVRGGQ